MGISPWTAYTAQVAVALVIVAVLLSILFVGAFAVVNYGLMSRREEDQGRGGQEPSDVGFLQRERFPEARSHREYLPAEEEPEEYWAPERKTTLREEQLLHEEDMPSDSADQWLSTRRARLAKRDLEEQGQPRKGA